MCVSQATDHVLTCWMVEEYHQLCGCEGAAASPGECTRQSEEKVGWKQRTLEGKTNERHTLGQLKLHVKYVYYKRHHCSIKQNCNSLGNVGLPYQVLPR